MAWATHEFDSDVEMTHQMLCLNLPSGKVLITNPLQLLSISHPLRKTRENAKFCALLCNVSERYKKREGITLVVCPLVTTIVDFHVWRWL